MLAYLPFNLQRRLIEGVHVPLSILAAIGFTGGLQPSVLRCRLAGWLARRGYPRPRLSRLVGGLILAFATPSTWYLLASMCLAAVGGYAPLYNSQAEVAAVLWLGEHTSPGDTLLSSYEIGGYVPARIGHRVFWGHWAESIHLPQKQADVQNLYSTSETLDRFAFLARYGIAYVFYGPRERKLGGFDPSAAPFLELAFQHENVAIYRVVTAEEL